MSNQDKTDETAAVLLEKIAEHAVAEKVKTKDLKNLAKAYALVKGAN